MRKGGHVTWHGATANNYGPYDQDTGSPLLSAQEAAAYLGVAEGTLAKRRMGCDGRTGPSFVKIGRRVFYRQCDLEAFAEANVWRHTGSGPIKG